MLIGIFSKAHVLGKYVIDFKAVHNGAYCCRGDSRIARYAAFITNVTPKSEKGA
jgi:hypothetical protein